MTPRKIRRRTFFPWKGTVSLRQIEGQHVDRLADAQEVSRSEILRQCVEAGLLTVQNRTRKQEQRRREAS